MYGHNSKTGKFIIGGRASFPVLVTPEPVGKNPKPGAKPKYQLTVVLNPSHQKQPWYQELRDAVEAAAEAKFGPKGSEGRPRKIKSPFLTIDDLKNKVPAGYTEDDVFIRLHSMVKPQSVIKEAGAVRQLTDAEIPTAIYAGCEVAVSVDFYAWTDPEGGSGVSIGLGNVMKVGDNDPWGATGTEASDDFGVDVEGGSAADDFI